MNKKIVNGAVKHLSKALYKEADECSETLSYENLKALENVRFLLCAISTMNEEIEILKRENHELKNMIKTYL